MRGPVIVGMAVLALTGACRAQPTAETMADLWPVLPPPRLAVAPTGTPPTIDGKVADAEWEAASVIDGFLVTDSPRAKGVAGFDRPLAGTRVRVTHDARHLYVAFRCEEPEIETLQVRGTQERDGPLWRDDCVEVFLQPPGADGHVHFIINSKGWLFDARAGAGGKSGSDWNLEGLRVATFVSKPGKGSFWSAELAIPLAGLGAAAPSDGEVWKANFARERYAAEYRATIEYCTWSGLVGGFERPDRFGELCFCGVRQRAALERPLLGRYTLSAELAAHKARSLKLEAVAASASGAETVGEATATLAADKATTVTVPAALSAEGTQWLGLKVADAATGRLLSLTRLPFDVPEVVTVANRTAERLEKLRAKTGAESAFAAGAAEQLAALAEATKEAKALHAGLSGPADDAFAKAWRALHEGVRQVEAASTFVVWTSSPYVAVGPETMPPKIAEPPELAAEGCVNEVLHLILNVTNLTEGDVEFHLDAGRLPGLAQVRSGLITPIQTIARHHPKLLAQPKGLPEKPDGLAMPLVELGGLRTFFVRGLTTRQVWLTVRTDGQKPGERTGRLALAPLGTNLPAIEVPWRLVVWPIEISDEAPLGVFCFDYAGDHDWMADYKINLWFRGAFPSRLELDEGGNLKPYKTDIGRVKRRMEEGAKRFLFSYGYAGSFIQWAEKNKIEYMSPRFKALFKEILSRMVREWREAGLDYGDFALQSIDEAHGRGVQQVIDTTPLIREVDPKVRTAMTIMTDLEDLKKMAPHVDVWINRNGALWGDEQAAFFSAEREKGKPIWSWNMPNNPKSKPITQFRTYGWRAMKFDFDAIGFFLYFGLVYQPMREGGGIATRHWEAWRDGVEDWQLLHALETAVAEAAKRGAPKERLDAARTVLAEAVDSVITDRFFPPNTQETHERILEARRRVAAEILQVRKAK